MTWHKNDSTRHHILLDDGSLEIGDIAPGACSSAKSLNVSGAQYHCTIHPTMVGSINVMTAVRRSLRRAAGMSGALVIALSAHAASAQSSVVAPVEHLSFDRPEAWASKYFNSTLLLSGLETPEELRPGSVAIGFELGWVPALSPAQERVGFDGTKQEDLNKAPIVARPRVRVGLPWGLSVIVAVNPPIKTFGITPRLLAAGLERRMYDRDGWRLGWRAYGQFGTATGAYTCPAGVLGFPPGSPNNSYGCESLSSDVATLRYIGGEVQGARRVAALRGLTPHLSVGVNYMNDVFQVNARTFGYLDRTRLQTDGVTVSVSGGVGYPLTNRISIAVDGFYTPLTVRRTFDAPVSNDGLFNVRALVSYRVH